MTSCMSSSCTEHAPGSTPRRRSVLQTLAAGGLLGAVAGPAGELTGTRYAMAAPGYTGDVLVVLSLRGGFDGLGAIVPVSDPDYLRLRPTIGVPAAQALPLDRTFGLHPALAPLLPLWAARRLAVVHAVGQADPSRSHFEAMAEMERAAPGTSLRTGWLDRVVGLRSHASAFQATQVGQTGLSQALAGPAPTLSIDTVKDFGLDGADDPAELARWLTALHTLHTGAPAVLAENAAGVSAAVAACRRIDAAGDTPAGGAAYPDTELGRALRDVVRLIRAGVGLQVAAVDFGNWDMHADVGSPAAGRMHDHLAELAQALAAFAADLGPAGLDGVTLVTLSEFGRRVEENGSGGVDHGHGNAVLLLGGGVQGGTVHGRWPGLSQQALVDGDLAGSTDYRVVLGEILTARCGVRSAKDVFPGLTGAPLGVVRPRTG
jgi:uncharacterized protein (DUF1501 family)